jgi:hypothetical protein
MMRQMLIALVLVAGCSDENKSASATVTPNAGLTARPSFGYFSKTNVVEIPTANGHRIFVKIADIKDCDANNKCTTLTTPEVEAQLINTGNGCPCKNRGCTDMCQPGPYPVEPLRLDSGSGTGDETNGH